MRYSLHLNPLANLKKWYTRYEQGNEWKTTVSLDTVILTKVKVKSINDVDFHDRYSNHLRLGAIRLGSGYVCD